MIQTRSQFSRIRRIVQRPIFGALLLLARLVGTVDATAQVRVGGQEWAEVGDLLLPPGTDSTLASPAGHFVSRPWPGGIVPIAFDPGEPQSTRSGVFSACQEWTRVANIRCVERTTETAYVLLTHQPSSIGACSSALGYAGQPGQPLNFPLNLNCLSVAQHELGHTLGLHHEHQRPDRDQYIDVLTENILPGGRFAYALGAGATNGPYDFRSIMHYGTFAFSISGPTMRARPGHEEEFGYLGMGRFEGPDLKLRFAGLPPEPQIPSHGDAAIIRELYGPPTVYPAEPRNTRVTSAIGNTGTIAWDPPAGGAPVTSYRVRFYRWELVSESHGEWRFRQMGQDQTVLSPTTFAQRTFEPGMYYAQVTSRGLNGEGLYAPGVTFVMPTGQPWQPPSLPGAPHLVGNQVNQNPVSVSWTPGPGDPLLRYEFWIYNEARTNGSGRPVGLRQTETTNLTENVTLRLHVKACNQIGCTSSNEILVRVDGTTLPLPPTLTAAQTTTNPITLSWVSDGGGTPQGYMITAGTSPGAANLGAFAMGLATGVTAVAPTAVRLYVRVIAHNTAGSASSNEISFTVDAPRPPALPVLTATQVATNPITLAWAPDQSGGAPHSFTLTAGTTPGATNLGTFAMGLATGMTAVAPTGVPLFLRVIAQNGAGSATSNEISFTINLPPPPAAPIVQMPVVTGSTVQLAWTGSAGTTFTLLARMSPSGPVLVSAPVGALNSLTVPGVGRGTYYVTAVAHSSGQTSGESNQVVLIVP